MVDENLRNAIRAIMRQDITGIDEYVIRDKEILVRMSIDFMKEMNEQIPEYDEYLCDSENKQAFLDAGHFYGL